MAMAIFRALVLLAGPASAAIHWGASFLGDLPVIQRDQPTEVWGTVDGAADCSGATSLAISVDGATVASAPIDTAANCTWRATIPAHAASFRAVLVAACAASPPSAAPAPAALTVAFGDVLLCGGQSNMGLAVGDGAFNSTRGAPPYGFHADNGTAESAGAAARYAGRISLKALLGRPTQNARVAPADRTAWQRTTRDALRYFSAVCWYAGKGLYERLGGAVPVGLVMGANGGTAIEVFMPRPASDACFAAHGYNASGPAAQRDCHQNASEYGKIYGKVVGALGRWRVGAILWDQAEADVSCGHNGALYACLQSSLAAAWRAGVGASAIQTPPFVAIQLPGYDVDCDQKAFGDHCGPDVFRMRLAQEQGVGGAASASGAVVATYDLSCPHCPFGSVHNTDKAAVGARAAVQLSRLMHGGGGVFEGPRASRATAAPAAVSGGGGGGGGYEVTVSFVGAAPPFALRPTRNCTDCCGTAGADFDASADGVAWFNGTGAEVLEGGSSVKFLVPGLRAPPAIVRYTAAPLFPQCAVANAEGLPALPFELWIS